MSQTTSDMLSDPRVASWLADLGVSTDLLTHHEVEAPWGLRWLDKLTEPGNPVLLYSFWVAIAVFYILGFAVDSIYLMLAVAFWFFAMPLSEDRAKLKRKRRREQWQAEMEKMEDLVYEAHEVAVRRREARRAPATRVTKVIVVLALLHALREALR